MADYAAWAARLRVPLHFALAVPVVVFARPTPSLLAGGAVLVVVGLMIRAWAAGHLRRERPLTTSGPYAYVRHPLYLGSAFVLAGFAVAAGRAALAAAIGLYFVLVFLPVVRREERERAALAPEGYAAYRARVPALVPYRGAYRSPEGAGARCAWRVWRANREWRGEVGCLVLLALLWAKMLWS